jgi:hypothetical protein
MNLDQYQKVTTDDGLENAADFGLMGTAATVDLWR